MKLISERNYDELMFNLVTWKSTFKSTCIYEWENETNYFMFLVDGNNLVISNLEKELILDYVQYQDYESFFSSTYNFLSNQFKSL